MRIMFECFVVLVSIVFAEWVKLDSPKDFFQQKPSKAWIKYQEERINHQTNTAVKNITSSSMLIIDPPFNATIPQNIINGKIELPATPKIVSPEEAREPVSRSSLTGFVNFLKILQGKLIRKGKSTITDKINLLKFLKNKIIKNIEARIKSLWNKAALTKGRVKRGILEQSSFEFPPETALITISFLTFSVFLIKLVLQVINVIKSKHYNMNGMAMITPAPDRVGLNGRSFGTSAEDHVTTYKILSAIERKLN